MTEQLREQLRVIPNPFCHLDHEGQPAGAYPYDPAHARGARCWVGARIDLSPGADGKPRTRALERQSGGDWAMRAKVGGQPRTVKITASPAQRTVFAFNLDPQTLPMSEHFVSGVRDGSLIAADDATAQRCGVKFIGTAEALKAAAEKAIADWKTAWGKPPAVETWPLALRAAAGLASPSATADADASAHSPTVARTAHSPQPTAPGGDA